MKLYYYYKDNEGNMHKIEDENCVLTDITPVLQELKTNYNTTVLACITNEENKYD